MPRLGQPAHDVPHHGPAARVDAGGRLVQEDDRRVEHQRHRQVESPAHPARIGRRGLPGGLGEIELVEQVGDALLGGPAVEVGEAGHEAEVLLTGE